MRWKVAAIATTLVSVLMLAAALVTSAETTQSKRRVLVQEIDFIMPEVADFSGLAQSSDAVTSVEILSRRPERRAGPRGLGADIVTVYTARIIEPFKEHGFAAIPSSTFTFIQRGGEIDTATEVLVAESGARLERGAEYVVFLKWNESLNSLELAYGPGAAFQLSSGRVIPLGASNLQQRARAMTAQELVAELRRRQEP